MVLATGGGTYVQAGNAQPLRDEGALIVFLEASPDVLLRRCYDSDDPDEGVRPLAGDRDSFLRLYEQRLPLYRTAELTVSSDHKSPEVVAREIAHTLNLLTT
jgi:shikimate kinase